MGKISDALEKQEREKSIKAQMLLRGIPDDTKKKKTQRTTPENYISKQRFNHKLVVYSAPGSVDAENFKVLRSQILFPKSSEKKRLIMVTSSYPGEGKSFIAANLAVSIAQGINEHVLLVDCDFRRPSLHEALGATNKEGLHEHLVGKKGISDVIIKTGIDKLSLITAGTPSHNPSELLGSVEMNNFFTETRDRYNDRFIVVDAAPLGVTSEAAVLANYVQGVIFVVMSGMVPKEIVKTSLESLDRNKILGVVFNGYESKFKRYDKYYKGYHK